MKQQLLSILLVMISILGIIDAGYLTYEAYSHHIPVCVPPFDCGKVLTSEWSKIAGIPLSVYGLLFYLTVFIFAVLNLTEVNLKIPVTKNVRNTLYALATFGFGFSLYLMYLQQFVIGAWCMWCAVSAITSTGLFIIAMLLKRVSKLNKQPLDPSA